MANGRIGDHPLTDIIIHGRLVYSERADGLVRLIVEPGGKDLIADALLKDYSNPRTLDMAKLEELLSGIAARLSDDARSRGWEV